MSYQWKTWNWEGVMSCMMPTLDDKWPSYSAVKNWYAKVQSWDFETQDAAGSKRPLVVSTLAIIDQICICHPSILSLNMFIYLPDDITLLNTWWDNATMQHLEHNESILYTKVNLVFLNFVLFEGKKMINFFKRTGSPMSS